MTAHSKNADSTRRDVQGSISICSCSLMALPKRGRRQSLAAIAPWGKVSSFLPQSFDLPLYTRTSLHACLIYSHLSSLVSSSLLPTLFSAPPCRFSLLASFLCFRASNCPLLMSCLFLFPVFPRHSPFRSRFSSFVSHLDCFVAQVLPPCASSFSSLFPPYSRFDALFCRHTAPSSHVSSC